MIDKDYGKSPYSHNNNNDDNKNKFWKRLMLVLVIILGLGAGTMGYFVYDFFYGEDINFVNDKKQIFQDSRINVLLMGYDAKLNGNPRSDTIMLASFDIEEKAVGIVSIPRDTLVNIPGHDEKRKINAAYAIGGGELAMKTVSKFLDIPVDYYVTTNFNGVKSMIDTLGGVELNVVSDMEYHDNAGDLHIDIKKGKQVLDGEKVVQYLRYRDKVSADLGRIQRQQKFVNAALDQFLSPDLIAKAPKLFQQFNQSIKTNMTYNDMRNMAKLMKDMKRSSIKTARIPGHSEYIDSGWYFIHNQKGTTKLVDELIASKEYIANSKYSVIVFNGNGIAGAAGDFARELELYGYNVRKLANADRYNYETTQIVYTDKLTGEIEKLADTVEGNLISFEESAYAKRESLKTYDILIIVGKDFADYSQ